MFVNSFLTFLCFAQKEGEIVDKSSKKYDKVTYNREYNARNYHKITVTCRDSEYAQITEYCEENDISKNKMFIESILYCIENGIKFE